ncbi:hypothetical protein J6590_020832 [Homalodisca vitripennis]|nr:hypothetical protein J6590_020832 [Homalodisca vitripennis]
MVKDALLYKAKLGVEASLTQPGDQRFIGDFPTTTYSRGRRAACKDRAFNLSVHALRHCFTGVSCDNHHTRYTVPLPCRKSLRQRIISKRDKVEIIFRFYVTSLSEHTRLYTKFTSVEMYFIGLSVVYGLLQKSLQTRGLWNLFPGNYMTINPIKCVLAQNEIMATLIYAHGLVHVITVFIVALRKPTGTLKQEAPVHHEARGALLSPMTVARHDTGYSGLESLMKFIRNQWGSYSRQWLGEGIMKH